MNTRRILNYSHGVSRKSTPNRSRTFYRLVTSPDDALPLRYSASTSSRHSSSIISVNNLHVILLECLELVLAEYLEHSSPSSMLDVCHVNLV